MPTAPFIIIAIDGGAASGKSSTARALADRFHLLHVDTGSFYRAISAEFLRLSIAPTDLAAVRTALPTLKLGTHVEARRATITLNAHLPVEAEIRGPAVNSTVAHFAAVPEVRAKLLEYQRDQARVAREHGFRGLVMDGRDIGSVIFPDADFRFYLFASPEERARRRRAQGMNDEVAKRDDLDAKRLAESLTRSTPVDNTALSLPQVVDHLAAIIATKLPPLSATP